MDEVFIVIGVGVFKYLLFFLFKDMESIWQYIGVFLFGVVIGIVLMVYMLKDEINNQEISIKKPKMKNTAGSTQQFTSNIQRKGLFKRLKNRKNEKQ